MKNFLKLDFNSLIKGFAWSGGNFVGCADFIPRNRDFGYFFGRCIYSA